MRNRLVLTAYDVICPRRLGLARRTVTGWAQGGQKSVLECWVQPQHASKVYLEMDRVLMLRFDKLGTFFIGRGERAITLGRAVPPRDLPAFIIG